MTKTETITREYDEDGRVIKETTVIESTDVICNRLHWQPCGLNHYPVYPVNPHWALPARGGTYTTISDHTGAMAQLQAVN